MNLKLKNKRITETSVKRQCYRKKYPVKYSHGELPHRNKKMESKTYYI